MTALVKLCCALRLQIAWQVRRLLQADRLLKMFLLPLHVGHLLGVNVVAIAPSIEWPLLLSPRKKFRARGCQLQEICWPVGRLQGAVWGPKSGVKDCHSGLWQSSHSKIP